MLKDREYGEMGSKSFLAFQYTTRRFYDPKTLKEIKKKYKWTLEQKKITEDLEEIEKLLGV